MKLAELILNFNNKKPQAVFPPYLAISIFWDLWFTLGWDYWDYISPI